MWKFSKRVCREYIAQKYISKIGGFIVKCLWHFKLLFSKATFGRGKFSDRSSKPEEVPSFLKAEVHLSIPNMVSYMSHR